MHLANHRITITSSKSSRRAGLTAVAMAAAMACGSAMAQGQSAATPGRGFAPGRILVLPNSGMTDEALDKLVKEHGGGKGKRVGQSELRIIEVPPGLEKQLVDKLSRHPHFKFAELDQQGTLAFAANDPYVGSQWHVSKTGADVAWDASRGAGVTIAIVDTGVDSTHPDLSPSMIPGWNFVDNNSNSADVMGHGTKAAGAAAAVMNNGIGTAGIAGQAKIMPIRVTAPDGSFYYSAVAQGLTWAADHGAKVANMSIYGALKSSSIINAAQYMKSKGGLVITSAGNNGIDEGWAATSAMVPVSATDGSDMRPSWSSYGGFVAMSAPGVGIWTTTMGGGYSAVSGTSFSSPVTSGVVALMMSANSKLTNTEIEKILFSTALDLGAAGRDPYFGYGRVNASAAVRAAIATSPTVDAQAPTTLISAPIGGVNVTGLVAVNVDATDNVGVSKVELWINGAIVAADTAAPYAFSWDSTRAPNGTANLVAVAFDAAGNSAPSAAVAVNVANTTAVNADTTAPTVSISNPAAGSQVTGTVSISVNSSDNAGAAGLKQSLFIDGKQVASATGATLSYRWNTRKLNSGTHTVEAVAQDAAGNWSTKAVQVVK